MDLRRFVPFNGLSDEALAEALAGFQADTAGEAGGFGEEALISEETRNATVTMIEDGLLMHLTADDFHAQPRAPSYSRSAVSIRRSCAAVWPACKNCWQPANS